MEAPMEDMITLEEAIKAHQKSKAAGRRQKAVNVDRSKGTTMQINTGSPVRAYLEIVDGNHGVGGIGDGAATGGEENAAEGENKTGGKEDTAMEDDTSTVPGVEEM